MYQMQVTAGNIHIHESLRVAEMTNLQDSCLQQIETSSINVRDLSNKVKDSIRKIQSHHISVLSMRCAKIRDLWM